MNAVHNKDALNVVCDVCDQLKQLFNMVRRNGESYRLFESRFNAQLCRFNSLGHSTTFYDAVSVVLLLNNANVDSTQRISILAAAAPTDFSLSLRLSTDKFIAAVRYEAVASVIRLRDASVAGQTSSLASAPFQVKSRYITLTARRA